MSLIVLRRVENNISFFSLFWNVLSQWITFSHQVNFTTSKTSVILTACFFIEHLNGARQTEAHEPDTARTSTLFSFIKEVVFLRQTLKLFRFLLLYPYRIHLSPDAILPCLYFYMIFFIHVINSIIACNKIFWLLHH